jgi:glycosyltransferase involved in cell wall biosynthesis
MTRPRVAFDVTPLQNMNRVRGIGRYVSGLARALAAQQEVPIEFWGWHDDRPFEVQPPHTGLWLRRFGLPRTRWGWFLGPLGMRLRQRMSRASVVHITDPRAFVRLGGATLTTVYDLIPLIDPQWQRTVSEWTAYQKYLGRLSTAAGIFAISNQTAEDLRRELHMPPPPVHVAPPGVEIPAAYPGAVSGEKYFLYVGSADPHKNLPVLLEAFARSTNLPERLVLVGPWHGPNVTMLDDWLGAHDGLRGRVSYQGHVPDDKLVALIRGATALVLPSRLEGFGLPVAEALAAGGIVIHSRIPVLNDVSQGAALTFDPTSAEELADGLQRLSGDAGLRAALREKGLARARELTWRLTLERTIAVYRSLSR